ncbi:pyridoxal-dependent decarboxylase [Anaerolineales bacterium HSG24]|nr:pyridoxal-dependent decarboxylase [Anaerolineales bacterium HSG24]
MSNQTPSLGEIDLDAFRQSGYQLIDWVADYLTNPEQYPVLAQVEPGDIIAQLPTSPPAEAEPLADIITDFEQIIMPGMTHWNHPNFFAYFSSTGSAPGVLGELLSAALNINGMLWRTSPAATELETLTLDWLCQMLALPQDWEGVIMDGASMSNMIAIAAAREALDLQIRTKGMAGRADLPRLRLYISEQSHSSVEKGALTLGLGQENVIKIPTDDNFALDAHALQTAIEADLAAGYRPFFVCGTIGTTSSTAIDPLSAIADLAAKYKLWFHVDGAYGGTTALLPEMRHHFDGVERADSMVVNPHKWMFTPIDLSVLYTCHPATLKRAFSILPEYLRTAEGDAEAVKNYMDYGVQLGRRFRALKLWMVIRAFGQEGLAARVREHIRLAQQFATWVDESPDFERLAPTLMSNVCFRACPASYQAQGEAALDQLNAQLLDAVNATGQIFISHTKLRVYSLRLAVGNIRTTNTHVEAAWQLLNETLRRFVDSGMGSG